MAYGDRMTLEIKDFGRKVVIQVKRGKTEVSKHGKKVTISYHDAPARKPK